MATKEKAGLSSIIAVIVLAILAYSLVTGNGGKHNKGKTVTGDARRVQFVIVYDGDLPGNITGWYSYGFGHVPINTPHDTWLSKIFWTAKGQAVEMNATASRAGKLRGYIRNLTTGSTVDTCENIKGDNDVYTGPILCSGTMD